VEGAVLVVSVLQSVVRRPRSCAYHCVSLMRCCPACQSLITVTRGEGTCGHSS